MACAFRADSMLNRCIELIVDFIWPLHLLWPVETSLKITCKYTQHTH